ncbi:MAG: NHL repeat-containing protein [Anaerosomatales bacterium]|nr:NHL repeat-containing protein [Anaerosomatales bacterium]
MRHDGEDPTDVAEGQSPHEEPVYTETIVEYVDNRQRKIVFGALIVVLGLLILLLAGSSYYVLYWTQGGSGAPAAGDLPEGLEWVRSIYGWGETADTSLSSPSDVAIAPDGSIWVISAAQMVVGFNPDGTLKQVIHPERGFERGQVDTLEGITVGPDGVIYVTDQGKGSIERFEQDGTWIGQWPANLPIEITSDGSDRLGVTGEGGFGVLRVLGDTAEILGSWGRRGTGETEFDLPHGVAFGADGKVFVSDTHNARVKALDQNGEVLWITEGTPRRFSESMEATTTSVFQLPSGMTVDASGRVVVVDPFGFNITVLDSETGSTIGQYGDYGVTDGLFAYPTGIDYDEDRDWFAVADTANNRVQVVRIPGSGGSPLAALRRNLVGPVWVCCIPLFLLLILLVAAVLRRRARGRQDDERAGEGAAADVIEAG